MVKYRVEMAWKWTGENGWKWDRSEMRTEWKWDKNGVRVMSIWVGNTCVRVG